MEGKDKTGDALIGEGVEELKYLLSNMCEDDKMTLREDLMRIAKLSYEDKVALFDLIGKP